MTSHKYQGYPGKKQSINILGLTRVFGWGVIVMNDTVSRVSCIKIEWRSGWQGKNAEHGPEKLKQEA